MRLEGKIALVTGAGRGIGRAVALTFAKEGANVVVNDIDLDSAETVANEIRSLGRQAIAIKCDVTKREEVNLMAEKALDRFKRIDILVNNAGIVIPAAAEEITDAQWDTVIGINLKGAFLCSQVIGRQMIKQKHGKIINLGSMLAHFAFPLQTAYCVAKGGVLQLTRALAVEWAKYNINVNSVSPGSTLTGVQAKNIQMDPNYYQSRLLRVPLRRLNQPEDIANAILFLASSESDNITGEDIFVAGGMSALHPGYIAPDQKLIEVGPS